MRVTDLGKSHNQNVAGSRQSYTQGQDGPAKLRAEDFLEEHGRDEFAARFDFINGNNSEICQVRQNIEPASREQCGEGD